ncbi:hypothetical protein NBH00_02405 [Paraconexibacter antarcticus]|uniref:DUF4878 domain-containing protein n=1 Tax=Paraconexibacter antarcticus TaxID=2949664 RepID=A0ABY5DWQ0_9ACTN|nr:hypothetical protein [Paraconexibacter antarcticus]UTI65070.1 hypothetical protein NBH00_02405 [Paraconexibacter antarcticus]
MNGTLSRTILTIAAGGTALAGCGGGNAGVDRKDPKAVVSGYLRAVADGDTKRACALLSPAVQQHAVKLLGRPKNSGVKTCPEALSLVVAQYSGPEKQLLRDVKVTKLEVTGTTAKVRSTASGPLTLSRRGGRWSISAGLFE